MFRLPLFLIFILAFLSVFEGLSGFYANVNLHIHEENFDARRGTEYQSCIDCAPKSLNFFHLEINITYFLWHVPVTSVNGNQPVNHFFQRDFHRANLG